MRTVNLTRVRERIVRMKKTVFTFGLIAGGILSAMMAISMLLQDRIGFEHGETIGYSTMVASFLLVYFGIRSYRDATGGAVGFGRAVAVGTLIVVVASACYVVTWEAIYFGGYGEEFSSKYMAHLVERERAKGLSQAQLDAKVAEFKKYAEYYKNPAINAAVTFLEPLPVGMLVALVSAGVLSRRRKRKEAEPTGA